MQVRGLLENWRELSLATHLQLDVTGLLGFRALLSAIARGRLDSAYKGKELYRRALLDSHGLETLVRNRIPWERLHANVHQGVVGALVVTALQIATGRTTMFAELAPRTTFRPSRDPRRVSQRGLLEAEHVLASAAIPLLFPVRRLGARYYCDGGLRFNTPLAPAIRCGAERLVVISPRSRVGFEPQKGGEESVYPSSIFLLGKVLNALLLDSVDYDLQVLERINRLWATLEQTLDTQAFREVQQVLAETRESPYRRLQTLVFRPSEDISHLASERAHRLRTRRLVSRMLTWVAQLGVTWEADLLSFILFDGEFARQLIALGHQDALQRAEEITAFFGEGT